MPDPRPSRQRNFNPDVAENLATLFHQLTHNPKTRRQIYEAMKVGAPEQVRGVFADMEVEDQLATDRKKREEDDNKRLLDSHLSRMAQQRQALLSEGLNGRTYSEEDLKKLEEYMQRKNLSDYNDGAVLWSHENPPPAPGPGPIPDHGATFEFPTVGNLSFKDFAANPTGAARNMAHQVITEIARARR